jgi:hypothetical protein
VHQQRNDTERSNVIFLQHIFANSLKRTKNTDQLRVNAI